MKPERKTWADLSTPQRAAVIAATAVQLALQCAALIDLHRRKSGAVNGDRRVWALATFVSFVGPIAYFAFGRKGPR